MRGIWTIACKDIRGLFLGPLFYLIGGMCTILWSVVYTLSLQEFARSSMMTAMRGGGEGGPNIHFEVFARHISLVNFIMILAVAALTMRLFAEEKKQRSFDLLLTSPVTATQIVLGKFIAGVTAAWAMVAISFLYPASVSVMTSIDWGTLLTSYLGLMLLVACYVAMGIFASALTESQVLAVVMALIFSVGIWFAGSGADAIENPIVAKVFEHLSISSHFVNFIKGSLSVASLMFFLSIIGLFTFLTQRVVESARWR